MTETNKEKRWAIAPYFFVPDVVATANYYRDKLGFKYDRFWGEPPCFCIIWRNSAAIMLSQQQDKSMLRPNNKTGEGGHWDAYIWVDDVKALHAELTAKGANIARGLCEQEYGCVEFDVEDNNGYRISFGQCS